MGQNDETIENEEVVTPATIDEQNAAIDFIGQEEDPDFDFEQVNVPDKPNMEQMPVENSDPENMTQDEERENSVIENVPDQPVIEEQPSNVEKETQKVETPPEESPSELTALRTQLKDMARQMMELQNLAASKPPEEQKLTLEDVEFLTNENFGDFLTNPASANALLNEVHRRGIATGREVLLKELPQLVRPQIEEAVQKRMMIHDFYAKNADLREHADYVGFVSQKLAKESTEEVDPSDFLAKVADTVRSGLGLTGVKPEQIQTTQIPISQKTPAFANPGGSRVPAAQKVSGLAAEIAEMLEFS